MTAMTETILEHHQGAARMWGAGGAGYDKVSFAISDALAHAAQRLNARPWSFSGPDAAAPAR